MSIEKSILEQLAEFTVGIDCSNVPEEINEKVKYCIMDALECCLKGSCGDPRAEAVWRYVADREGKSAIFAKGKKLKTGDAAFYNTVTGAISSRNDISKIGSCHPGSIVVPVALALAEERGSNGKQIMEAVLAGYESMIRLGIAIRMSSMPKAFRSTAILGPFGAAFTAAKMLGLSVEETVNAVSFACHCSGGFNNWVSEGTGEDVLQNGWGARNGLEAALLAKTGLPAAKYVLEDKDGLLSAFSALEQKTLILKDIGKKWYILDVEYKPMSSCLKLAAPCQIAKKLLKKIPDIHKISEIRIGVAEKTLHHAGTENTDVTSRIQAIMSIPFGVANVLVFGDYSSIQWDSPYDKEVLDIMKLCRVEEQKELTSLFPSKRGAELTILMDDKTKLQIRQDDVEGLQERDVEALFDRTTADFYGDIHSVKLKKIIMNLDEQKDLKPMFEILIGGNV